MKKIICFILVAIISILICFTSCEYDGSYEDIKKTVEVANEMQTNQATPTDIDYSLERYNLIKRAYWVNGQREKAMGLPCAVDRPLGYIVLFTESGSVIGRFVVDGKVSSLNSFLTPNYRWVCTKDSPCGTCHEEELSDIDGSYGENDNGIFFFTADGKYIEWTGIYLYSDIPFEVSDPIVKIGE